MCEFLKNKIIGKTTGKIKCNIKGCAAGDRHRSGALFYCGAH